MPEGDTLRRIALNLERALLEGRVSAFFSTSAALEAAALRQRLVGTRVLGCEARGKHLLIHFESGAALHTHLGLHGSWRLHSRATLPPRLERRARVALETDRVVAACLGRGTTVELLPPGGVARHPGLLRLGPDLLAPDFDAGEAGARLCRLPDEAIGVALLRQTVMRGDDVLVDGQVRVAFVSRGRPRPIPKPLRLAMKADQDLTTLAPLS